MITGATRFLGLIAEITPVLATARARGRAIHTGVPMLEAQIELMLRFMGVAPTS